MAETLAQIPKDEFYAMMGQGSDPAQVKSLLDFTLDKMGWSARTSFSPEDALTISLKIAELSAQELSTSADPNARELGEGIQMVLDPVNELRR